MRLDWPVSRKTEAMKLVLQLAVIAVVFSVFGILFHYGRRILHGSHPTKFFAFFAILFTSGLDVGLIMFPLTEFPLYEVDAAYGFTNPLAIEFGFWGFFIWLFYFLTTFYFCLLEPKLRLFEIPAIKAINNVIIITTCSFTGYLFLQYLPDYIEGISCGCAVEHRRALYQAIEPRIGGPVLCLNSGYGSVWWRKLYRTRRESATARRLLS
jgi:choline-glycine betaine transporter